MMIIYMATWITHSNIDTLTRPMATERELSSGAADRGSDVLNVAGHEYLSAQGATSKSFAGLTILPVDSTIELGLHLVPSALFPGETVPIKVTAYNAAERGFIESLLREDSDRPRLLAGVVGGFRRTVGFRLMSRVGVTLEIKSASERNDEVGIIAIARQRFEIQADKVCFKQGVPHATIRILDTPSYMPLPPFDCVSGLGHVHPLFWRTLNVDTLCDKLYSSAKEANLLTAALEHRSTLTCSPDATEVAAVGSANAPLLNIEAVDVNEASLITIENDKQDLSSLLSNQPLKQSWQSIALDPTEFSFWLGRSLPMRLEDKQALLEESCIYTRLRRIQQLLQYATVYCCSSCSYPIVKQSDLISFTASGISSVFVNPHGLTFRVVTSKAVMPTAVDFDGSRPSTDSTWYRGYGWTIIYCRGCGAHLGWRYDYMPDNCAGLAGKRVVWLQGPPPPATDAQAAAPADDAAPSAAPTSPPVGAEAPQSASPLQSPGSPVGDMTSTSAAADADPMGGLMVVVPRRYGFGLGELRHFAGAEAAAETDQELDDDDEEEEDDFDDEDDGGDHDAVDGYLSEGDSDGEQEGEEDAGSGEGGDDTEESMDGGGDAAVRGLEVDIDESDEEQSAPPTAIASELPIAQPLSAPPSAASTSSSSAFQPAVHANNSTISDFLSSLETMSSQPLQSQAAEPAVAESQAGAEGGPEPAPAPSAATGEGGEGAPASLPPPPAPSTDGLPAFLRGFADSLLRASDVDASPPLRGEMLLGMLAPATAAAAAAAGGQGGTTAAAAAAPPSRIVGGVTLPPGAIPLREVVGAPPGGLPPVFFGFRDGALTCQVSSPDGGRSEAEAGPAVPPEDV